MDPTVLVVGSVNMDLVARVDRLPRPGENVRGTDFRTVPGNKGANQAVACARLGARTRFLVRVGDDASGDRLRRDLDATLALECVKGTDLVEAARVAGGAGALACLKLGAQPSLPTADEVAALLEREA